MVFGKLKMSYMIRKINLNFKKAITLANLHPPVDTPAGRSLAITL